MQKDHEDFYIMKKNVPYYQWEKLYNDGVKIISEWLTDEEAEEMNYKENGWKKIQSSERISRKKEK